MEQGSTSDQECGLKLNIGVVGAGISGLAAAAMLARLGHHVDVSLQVIILYPFPAAASPLVNFGSS